MSIERCCPPGQACRSAGRVPQQDFDAVGDSRELLDLVEMEVRELLDRKQDFNGAETPVECAAVPRQLLRSGGADDAALPLPSTN